MPPTRTQDFAHLYVRGGWGDNLDTRVYSDDTYVVTRFDSGTRQMDETHTGYRKGLFSSLIRLAKRDNAWSITTASLQEDVQKAAEARHSSALDVTDQNTDFLELHSSGKNLRVEFYATDSTLETFPEVKSLRTFAKIIHRIKEETLKTNRESGSTH